MGRLREDFAAWAQRDLGELRIRYLLLDGWYPRVRIGKKRVRTPAQDGFRLDDHQAFAPLRPPERQQDPKQKIYTPEARATSSAALQHGNLMAQRDRFQQQ